MKELNKITIGNCTLYHGDCFDVLPKLESKADAVISDPPYNNTACDWDVHIPLAYWWDLASSRCKPSANYVLFAAGHFAIDLANSKYKWYRYDLVWAKNNKVGFFNANLHPMRAHENILIFGKPGERNTAAYNPQKSNGGRRYKRHNRIRKEGVYPEREYITEADGTRHPCSVLEFSSARNEAVPALHPTQKPVALLEFLIKSYTNEKDVVLDPFMGSGTAGVACAKSNRQFIGIEKEKKYFDIAVKRMKEVYENTEV